MRHTVAISLPDNLLKKLSYEAKEENSSRSAVIRKALKQHFFVEDIKKLRNMTQKELAKKGIKVTEEQLFNEIS